jgi:hypothetical protein
MKLKTKRLGRHWWIVGDEEAGPYGPYKDRAEAEEDRRGLMRTYENFDDPSFWTSEKQAEVEA